MLVSGGVIADLEIFRENRRLKHGAMLKDSQTDHIKVPSVDSDILSPRKKASKKNIKRWADSNFHFDYRCKVIRCDKTIYNQTI